MSSVSAMAFRARARRPRPRRATSLPALPKDCPIVVDGLAFGVLPEAANELRERQSAAGAGASSAGAGNRACARRRGQRFEEQRVRRACGRARRRRHQPIDRRQLLVDDYDVPPELITVALPGTDRGETAKGSSDGIVRLARGRLGGAAQGLSMC